MIYRNEAAINWTAPLTLVDARTAVDRGKAFAAVEIPADTERDVLKAASDAPKYRSLSSSVSTAARSPRPAGEPQRGT